MGDRAQLGHSSPLIQGTDTLGPCASWRSVELPWEGAPRGHSSVGLGALLVSEPGSPPAAASPKESSGCDRGSHRSLLRTKLLLLFSARQLSVIKPEMEHPQP